MKRFLSTVAFCIFLLIFGLFALLPKTQAEKNLLQNLLNLPAPPPPNPQVVNVNKNHGNDFFSKVKPPPDDAPIEDIIAYWQRMNQLDAKYTYAPEPTEKTLEKLYAEIEKNPETLPSLLNALPETPDAADMVKRYYDRETADEQYGKEWRETVKRWLTYHSPYFSDDLLKTARTVGDTNEYVTNQAELLALARVDWDKARPILERLVSDSSQPVSQTLARWAFYQHAMREKDSSDIDKYRKQLQETVENKNNKPGNRDLAMDALIESGDFEGRDDWYYSLMSDETLEDLRVNGAHYTGLTTIVNHSSPDKYTAKMLELVKSGNPTVRGAAARNLASLLDNRNVEESKDPEIVRALLPWLEDENWAKETNGERRRIIDALRYQKIPESVPGLIAALNEKQSVETVELPIRDTSNVMVRPNGATTVVDVYPLRDGAINALTVQADARASVPLRMLLPQIEGWQRGNLIRALVVSKGFSVPEEIEALELVAKNFKQPSELNTGSNVMMSTNAVLGTRISPAMTPPPPYLGNTIMGGSSNPSDIKPLLGAQLVNIPDPDEELVTTLIDRINVLDTKEPALAYGLRQIMKNWSGTAINALMLRDLKNNRADTDVVVKLLTARKELREKQWSEVNDTRNGTPTALGIAGCLLDDAGGFDALLQSQNDEAKTAMLACARLIRAPLAVRKVAENLRSPNKLLAQAAELYLESEDSAEARTIVLSLHPNEAKILGATTMFDDGAVPVANNFLSALFASVSESPFPYYYRYRYTDDIQTTERKLQKEVKENQELVGVYAYDKNFVRIYKDRAVFSWQEDAARYRERDLTKEEFNNLKGYLAAENAGELPPFLSLCSECANKELLMLGRQGGRRVFNLSGEPAAKFFADLEAIFTDMRREPGKLHYWLEKSLPGLEILFEDENRQAEAVWKSGDDFRVLINDQARRKQIDKELDRQDDAEEDAASEDSDYEKIEAAKEKRRVLRAYENYTWHKFLGGKIADLTDQPAPIEFLPKQDGLAVRSDERQWKARAGSVEIRADEEGLFKVVRGQISKIRDGFYNRPLVTPNGRWVIAIKYGDEEAPKLVRINLQTNKQFIIKNDENSVFDPVAFVPSLNRVLLYGGGFRNYEGVEDESERNDDYYLLDAETGIVQSVKGEIHPLVQQTFRPLQPTGNADEFWAAIPTDKEETQIGVYNAKTLVFKSLLNIPQIKFNSMKMWVDAGKVYFVYEGHLLALPLPK